MSRAAAVTLLLVFAACGRRSRPLPPELVQPLPPTTLVARSTEDGVEVAWHRPDRYSGGQHMRDLGGFDIERAPGDGPQAGTFVLVNHLVLTDQYRFRMDPRTQWIDHDVQAGTRYQYRVTAFTLDGYRSTTAGPVTMLYTPKPAKPSQ